MSIGVGIFLIAVGAILAFGIRDDDAGAVDLTVVGVVIMLAGAAGIWLSYKITNDRRRVPTDAIDPAVEEQYRTIEASHAHDQHHTRVEHVTDGHASKSPVTKPAKPRTTPTQSTSPQPVQSELGDHFDPVQAVDKPRTAPPADELPVTEQPPSTERTVELDPSASGLPEQPRRRSR
ncbi:DUF6458 family protein [Kribbella sp. ALI-6-A]|uniref:DUF6458 family protein n=1 Tax=Kribbella sp. ALI-6-A TaxID=1933817 RepID=UPI001875BE9A|nr:DUF6458 family protein [Kribbella sp. ALI-6-A]